jgi:hypothetical protein
MLTWGALLCAAIPALTFLRNLRHFEEPALDSDSQLPPVSVLVPARNEADSIGAALVSILAERDLDLEVVVLDDGSTDATASVVASFCAIDDRVRLETAPPLPPSWNGKQHACAVLASHARNDVLVFMDADVRLEAQGLRRAVSHLVHGKARLVSGFPRQITGSPLERWLLPLIHFVLLGFLPMWRMRRSTSPAYGAGCGQLMLVDRISYEAAGGHGALRDSLHDGLKLPRALRSAGFFTGLFDATAVARCRMYTNAREVWNGLGKNATEGLAASATLLPATVLLAWGQVIPLPLFLAALLLNAPALPTLLAGAAVLLSLVPRAIAWRRFRQPGDGVLTHGLGVLLLLAIQWQAFLRHHRGVPVSWRNRSYSTNLPPAVPRNG